MTKKIAMILVAVCCIVLPGYADKGVALVTAVKGDVTRGGQAVKIFTNLAAGDKVHAGAGAQITLMFLGDQHKETVTGDTTFAVAAAGTNAPANKKTVEVASGGLKVKGGTVAMLNSDQYGGVAKRGGGNKSLVLTTPHYSLSTSPQLTWTPVDGAATYVVSVEKSLGDEPFITQTVSGTSVKLNQTLDREKIYYYKVEARNADGQAVVDDVADIEVISNAKASALKTAEADFEAAKKKNPDDMAAYLAMAGKYMDEQLFNEAIGVFQQMAAKNPSTAYPHQRLSALYHSLGMDKEAKEQASIAAQLGN